MEKNLPQLSCSFIKHGCSMHLRFACITTFTYCTRAADITLCHTEKKYTVAGLPCKMYKAATQLSCKVFIKCQMLPVRYQCLVTPAAAKTPI